MSNLIQRLRAWQKRWCRPSFINCPRMGLVSGGTSDKKALLNSEPIGQMWSFLIKSHEAPTVCRPISGTALQWWVWFYCLFYVVTFMLLNVFNCIWNCIEGLGLLVFFFTSEYDIAVIPKRASPCLVIGRAYVLDPLWADSLAKTGTITSLVGVNINVLWRVRNMWTMKTFQNDRLLLSFRGLEYLGTRWCCNCNIHDVPENERTRQALCDLEGYFIWRIVNIGS